MLCVVDFAGKFVRVNPALQQALGYSLDELIGKPLVKFLHPEDVLPAQREMEKYLRSGEPTMDFENRYICRDGSIRRFSWRSRPVPEEQLVYGAARDITELHATAEALRASQEHLSITLNAIGEGVIVTDVAGRITRMNPVAERLTGWSFEEAAGRSLAEVFHIVNERTRQPETTPLSTDLAGDTVSDLEGFTALIGRNGVERSIHDTATPLRDAEGHIIGTVVVFRDVTLERLTLETAQRRTQKTLSFQKALLKLRDTESGDLANFYRLATEQCALALQVDRVGIWLFNEEHSAICLEDLYQLGERAHSSGQELSAAKYPSYFRAISSLEPILAEHACSHPATFEFAESYMKPLGVVSTMDMPIRAGGTLTGVLCCEQTGTVRQWTADEAKFAGSVASYIMIAIEQNERLRAEEQLRQLNAHLEQRIAERTAELVTKEARFRALFYSQFQFIGLLSPSGVLLEVNETALHTGGLQAEDVIGRYFWETKWWDVPGGVRSQLKEAIGRAAQGEFVRYEVNMRGAGGRLVPLDFSITPVRDNSTGAVTLLIPEGRDLTESKAAVAALRQSEERFRLMIEQVEDRAIIMLDPDGHIATWNTGAERVKGYSAEEIIGRHVSCFYTDEDVAAQKPDTLLHLARTVGHVSDESWRVRKDRSLFWAEVVLTALRDEEGILLGFSKITRDLTERRRAEDALRESEEQFRSAMENSAIGMSIVSLEGRYMKVNRAVCEILGYSEEELLNLDFQSITNPDDCLNDREMQLSMLEGKTTTGQTEKRYVHKDGHTVWALVNVSLVRDSAGQPRFFITQVQDITAQKQATEHARLATQRMQLATQAGRIGIWEVDVPSGRTTWDEQMYEIYGLTPNPSDTSMEKGNRSMHPDDRAKIAAAFSEVLIKGERKSRGIEYRIYHGGTGELRFIHSKATTLRDEAGVPHRVIGICWDVTEERRREEALSKALAQEKELVRQAQAGEHAKGEFLAVMSHEIRTPINGILGFAEILSRSPDIPTEGRDYAQTILDSSETLLRILDDVLDFSRLEAGRLSIEKTPLSPRRLVQEIGALLAPSAREKGLSLGFDLDENTPPSFNGDPARLRQILLNLGVNAIKFTASGSVTFGLRNSATPAGEPFLDFFVRDTGLGIAADRLDKIFEPFVQADSSTSRRYGGTGLGLTISRRLARLMGGDLVVSSTIGQGTEFRVRLPRHTNEETPRRRDDDDTGEALDESFATRHPLTILVVDDDRVNLKLMLTMIRKFGYQPVSATNGSEAVEVYQKIHPDCILMDLQMPGMDGIDATIHIRRAEKTLGIPGPFIFALTANTVPADRARCFEAGMNDYLNKPVRRAALARILVKASDHLRSLSA